MKLARNLYLIIRGEKPSYHNAPFHPIIICSRKHTAQWEAGDVDRGCTVFYNAEGNCEGCNWFAAQYKGYGCECAHHFTLFDGVHTASFTREMIVENYIRNAVWWSSDRIPKWLEELGVKLPEDEFSLKSIREDLGTCRLPWSKQLKMGKC